MSLLVLVIGIPIFLSLQWTHELFQRLYELERVTIAVDNMAIELGRADRRLFRSIIALKKRVSQLEKVHHIAHLCARSPEAAKCIAQDRALEETIRNLIRVQLGIVHKIWRTNILKAKRSLFEKMQLCALRRSTRVPIQLLPCSICGLRTRIHFIEPKMQTSLKVCSKKHQAKVRVKFNRVLKWDYLLANW